VTRSALELRQSGQVWEVVRDGRVLLAQLFRHGTVHWTARKLELELAAPARANTLEFVGVEWAELEAVLAEQ
jgi:hypothetical protein